MQIPFVFVAAAGRDNDELPGALCPDVNHWGGYAARWGFDRSSLVAKGLPTVVDKNPSHQQMNVDWQTLASEEI
ncbi:MAG: hypothetical protein ABSF71_37795 [Terriglobia bacterium]|jgi:hypothetical protein